MRVAALLAIPGCFATAMLFLAIPAGDWLDDSPLLLTGLPALASGLVTYGLWQRRNSGVGAAAGWALTSERVGCPVLWPVCLGCRWDRLREHCLLDLLWECCVRLVGSVRKSTITRP